MKAGLQSTKIMQRRAEGDVEVGDWLATGKQGVVYGLHPSGRMNRPNEKPLVVIQLAQFRLPRDCYLGSQMAKLDRPKEQRRKMKFNGRPHTYGSILDVSRLHGVHQNGKGIQAACPACRADGRDSAGDNLLIWPDGRYNCAAFIGHRPTENHEHNQRIYRLIGMERNMEYE